MNRKNQQPVVNTTRGFFVTFCDESSELKKSNLVNTGRNGVFYKKEDLIDTLKANDALKDKQMDIIEIEVPNCVIINPNHIKFGFKGGNIPIRKIQSFATAKKEMERMAIV